VRRRARDLPLRYPPKTGMRHAHIALVTMARSWCFFGRCSTGEATRQSTDRFDPHFWVDHAADARAIAAKLDDPDARRLMLEIAAIYDSIGTVAGRGRAGRV